MDNFEGVNMRQKKFLFLTIQQFVFLAYFILTTAIFFIAVNQGNEGVTLRLFGGGDDGFFYWTQARNIAAGPTRNININISINHRIPYKNNWN